MDKTGDHTMQTTSFMRRVSILVLITFTSLTLQPLQAVAQAKLAEVQATQPTAGGNDELYAKLLDAMKETAKRGADKAAKQQSTRDDSKTLRSQKAQLIALEAKVDDAFAATEADLIAKNLPAEILARHRAAVQAYKAKQAEFKQQLKVLEDADNKDDEVGRAAGINNLAAWLEQNQKGKPHNKTNPNKLPFGTPTSKVRAPIETAQGFKTSLFRQEPVRLAGAIPNGFTMPATATLPALPTADDLAATEDVQITQAIKDQAAKLNNNPVQIYNWVRNNIAFIPSYGSIQGSDMTLQNKRGNAFDTASLLIALYRAAGIPARYVYGTIDVPADKVMNWVGGVTKAEAAQSLLGQGGIPNSGITSGGIIKTIRMEHVWVQAYVDYTPSRGAVNKTPNTWVPMDASFKQYIYTQGVDVRSAVPLDAQALVTQAQSGATLDASGWVQNMNGAAIQSALASYQTQVQTYINSQRTNVTVGDVIGSKTIIPQNYSLLLGTLPYTTIATGSKFTALPDQVRHQFDYNLYASALDRAMGTPVVSLRQSLPSLAGKKITLSFAPASPADMSVLNSYLPLPHADGTPISPNEFPTSLPGYLIHLTAELRLDGKLVATGGTFTMGEELTSSEGLFDPAAGWDYAEDTHPTAGEYIATHVDLQGVSPSQLVSIQTKMTQTQTSLQSLQFRGDKDDLTGDLLYSAVLSYFAANFITSNISSRAAGVVEYRKPSFGNFFADAQPLYWFGIPHSVAFRGLVMDIQRYASINVAKDNSPTTVIAYNKQVGMTYSANEHIIPEQLFTSPADSNRTQGISAVKALALAAGQGQKIYTLNQANQAQHQALLAQITIDPQAMEEIQNALAVGNEVTVHQAPITQSGWTGSCYIISDPATGSGAYKIAGGFNGAGLPWNTIGAAFGAMLDALLAHYRDPGSMFGSYFEKTFAEFGRMAAATLAVALLIIDIEKTVSDSSMNAPQKIAKIVGAAASAVAGLIIGASVGPFFASPAVAVIAAMILVVLASILIDLLVNWMVGTIALFRRLRYGGLYAA